MLKKRTKLKVAPRSPAIYYTDLRILKQDNSNKQNQASDLESH